MKCESKHLLKSVACYIIIVLLGLPGVVNAHVEAGMPDSVAEIEYLMFLDMKPGNIVTRYKLGMVYYRQKKFDKSTDQLTRVLKKEPGHFLALEGLGRVKTAQNDHGGAIAVFHRAIKLQPENSFIYYYLGMAYENAGMTTEAEKAYRTALENQEGIPQLSRDDHYADDLVLFQNAIKLLEENQHANK